MMGKFVARTFTPGLPFSQADAAAGPVFNTAHEAWAYHAGNRLWFEALAAGGDPQDYQPASYSAWGDMNELAQPDGYDDNGSFLVATVRHDWHRSKGTGVIWAPTPGVNDIYDKGVCYQVSCESPATEAFGGLEVKWKAGDKLHNDDGSHRGSARSAVGHELDWFEAHYRTHAAEPCELHDKAIALKGEFSERGRYVTEQVKLWIANDGDYIKSARLELQDTGLAGLAGLLTAILRDAKPYSAPWQVDQELAPNDYDRIHWDDVAAELAED